LNAEYKATFKELDMKNSITLLAGVSMLSIGAIALTSHPAMAQTPSGPFADVPADHWAYTAVQNLQTAGVVIGYPDGTYGGKRPMTRYEFAVAIARILPKLDTGDKYATKDDLASLRSELEDKLMAQQGAIDDLKKLVDEFQPELDKLGQDVSKIDQRLDALEARVSAVEEEQRRVKFNGWLNVIGRAAVTNDAGPAGGADGFIDENGEAVGLPIDTSPYAKHLFAEDDVLNDFLLGVRGKLSDSASVIVKIDFGNFLTTVGNTEGPGTQANGNPPIQDNGIPTSGSETTTLWEAYVSSPVSLGPLGGGDVVAGRFPNQETKYTLKQIDADVYTYLYQTDNGNIPTDGAKVNFKLGPAGINAWAGKFTQIPFAEPLGGTGFDGNTGHRSEAEGLGSTDHLQALSQGAGLRATFGTPGGNVLGFTVEQFGFLDPGPDNMDPNRPDGATPYDRLTVYGADLTTALPILRSLGLSFDGSWTDSAQANSSGFNNVGNGWQYNAVDTELGVVLGSLSVKGGYQYVGPQFSAPGSWGRLGAWINPTNITGGVVNAKYAFSGRASLNADYEGYKTAYGTTNQGLAINSPLQSGDDVDHYQVGLNYGLSNNYDVDLGYENVTYTLKTNAFTTAGSVIAVRKDSNYVRSARV
jgi:uncharacterized coiled-coil protein SlyX